MQTSPNSSSIVREALLAWALAFGGLVLGKVIGFAVPFVAANLAALAAFLFLFVPRPFIRKRGEELEDYALPPWPWTSKAAALQFRHDVAWALGVSLILFPLVVVGFFVFLAGVAHLPPGVRSLLVPYPGGGAPHPTLRFPADMALQIPFQFLVVALPEEFFYRGYIQTRLTQAWGKGSVRVLGANLGWAFVLTQVLFALGHLAELHPWRLAVFFPALLFGWLRERTDSVIPGVIVHALSNLVLLVLETSAFG